MITHRERYQIPSDEDIKKSFDDKYGSFDDNIDKYLEKAFIEVVEADKLEGKNKIEQIKKEVERLELKNHAQFLFKLRYPAETMFQLNEQIIRSIKIAGFNFLSDPDE